MDCFEQHFGRCPAFAIHDYTNNDIQIYIETRLEPMSSEHQQASMPQHSLIRLIGLFADRALGVFIRVRLVVDLLSKGIRDGTPYFALEEQVNRMPQEVKDLYAVTLRRVEPEYTTEAFIMLQTALCSLDPLPLKTFMANLDHNLHFHFGCPATSVPDPIIVTSSTDAKVNVPTDLQPVQSGSQHYEKSRLASRSGGLLQTISPNASDNGPEGPSSELFVQFIHQTVKEYVQVSRYDLGLVKVSPQIYNETGVVFLLISCEVIDDAWPSLIKRNVFTYVKRGCATTSSSDATRPTDVGAIVMRLAKSLPEQGTLSLKWWLSRPPRDHESDQALAKYWQSLGNSRSEEAQSVLNKLAVAANFCDY